MEKQNIINYEFIERQLSHWLNCPTNGYLGSDYGIDLKQYLYKPMNTFDANSIIAKMRADIPVLSLLPESAVNIFVDDLGNDGKRIYIQVAEKAFQALAE